MEFATIVASPRTVLGKKVKALRREGTLPGNVFGKGLDSVALQMDAREFLRIVRGAGVRSMFRLSVDGETSPRYVFIRGLMREGGMGDPRHVDFYQVQLDKPIETSVAVKLVGEAPAVRDLAGTLVTAATRVTVRTLPLEVPDHVEADLVALNGFEAQVTVANIKPLSGVEIVDDPSTVLATATPPRIRLDAE